MRLRARVIPVLLLRRRGLVKTTRFATPTYVGDPINTVRIFNEKEVDELVLSEITATKDRAEPDFELIEQIASEAFMPLCYGGGVRTVPVAKRILRLGIEKVSVNSAALEDPTFIRRLADELGSQCVVSSVDVRRAKDGTYTVHSHAGLPVRERDPIRWIQRLVDLGAGEILVNAVDRDGTMSGFDADLLRALKGRFDVPVIACGGARSVDDMATAIRVGSLDALGVGAKFVFEGPYRAVLVTYLSPEESAVIQDAHRSMESRP